MEFWKYQGAGNDFVMVDDRRNDFDENNQCLIEKLCDRRFGIGADGLILLRVGKNNQLEMVYFNSDGRQSSMCGNGGRCFASFANFLGLVKNKKLTFLAIDGLHDSIIDEDLVNLKMMDVKNIEQIGKDYYLDTGSPHYVSSINELSQIDIIKEAHNIRYNSRFEEKGTNVNFVKFGGDVIELRTYERGVENETLACGTGVTAVALVAELIGENTGDGKSTLKAQGGNLEVSYNREKEGFKDIWLKGSAVQVYKGEIDLESNSLLSK
mgnify:CR=1 FL=1